MTYCHVEPNGFGMREVWMCVEVVLTLSEDPWETEQQERQEQSWRGHSDGRLQVPLTDPPVPTLYPTVPADPPLPAACNTSSYCSGSHVSIVNMQNTSSFPPRGSPHLRHCSGSQVISFDIRTTHQIHWPADPEIWYQRPLTVSPLIQLYLVLASANPASCQEYNGESVLQRCKIILLRTFQFPIVFLTLCNRRLM